MTLAIPLPTVEVSFQGEAAAQVAAIAPWEQWETWFQQWIAAMAVNQSPLNAYELSIQFTTDAVICALNAQYRQQDIPTDVLSFSALEGSLPPAEMLATQPLYLGDLVISVETAERQCGEHHHTLLEELVWLATHGFLHLLGWDHPNEERLQAMLAQQQQLLRISGLYQPQSAYALEASCVPEED